MCACKVCHRSACIDRSAVILCFALGQPPWLCRQCLCIMYMVPDLADQNGGGNVEGDQSNPDWDGTHHVVACRTGGEWGQGLRSMVGSSDEQAALRAIESLSVSYDVDELV